MHKPLVSNILVKLDEYRRSQNESGLDATMRTAIGRTVVQALRDIEADPDLKFIHEVLTGPQVDASVRHYANEVASGLIPNSPQYLIELLTVMPVQPSTQTAAATPPSVPPSSPTPPIAPAPAVPFWKMLENPMYMAIFRDAVNDAVSKPGEPGYKAAQFLKPLVDDDRCHKDLRNLFREMNVESPTKGKPSDFGQNHQTINQFMGMLTGHQRNTLYKVAVPPNSNTYVRRAILPNTPYMEGRRAFLVDAPAAIYTAYKAYSLHSDAAQDVLDAANAPKKATPEKKGKGITSFGPVPAQAIQSETGKQKIADAGNKEDWATGYAIASGVFALDGIVQASRRTWRLNATDFKDETGNILKKMDPLVEAAHNKITGKTSTPGPTP